MCAYFLLTKVTTRDESFLDLSIDIEANASISGCLRSVPSNQRRCVFIIPACRRNFSSNEFLKGDTKFYCDGCCSHQEAQKRYVDTHALLTNKKQHRSWI